MTPSSYSLYLSGPFSRFVSPRVGVGDCFVGLYLCFSSRNYGAKYHHIFND